MVSVEVRVVRWGCGLSGSESCQGGGVVSVEVRTVSVGCGLSGGENCQSGVWSHLGCGLSSSESCWHRMVFL